MSMKKTFLQLAALSAMMASSAQDSLFMAERKRANKKVENPEDRERRKRANKKVENPEDRERRERCEQMAIEKAKAKRERKALKRMKNNELNARKED